MREFLHYRAPESQTPLREANIEWRNLERTWRTKQEEELGREFTEAEAAEYERAMKLRVAQHMVEHRAESIHSRLTQSCDCARHRRENRL